MKRLITAIFLTGLLGGLLSGCGVVYKQDVQQGNVLDQDMIDQLRPGMSKRQVSLVMGSPAISSPFHHDRWDYVYTFQHRGGDIAIKTMTLVFEDEQLVRIEGDYLPSAAELLTDTGS